jgi:hypothetical protein
MEGCYVMFLRKKLETYVDLFHDGESDTKVTLT